MKRSSRIKRIERLKGFLEKNSADLFVTSIPHEIYFFTGTHVEGHFVYGNDVDLLFTSKLYIEQAESESLTQTVLCSQKDYSKELKQLLSGFKGLKVLLSVQESVAVYGLLKKAGLKVKAVDTQTIRMHKDDEELSKIETSYRIIESAIVKSLEVIKEGVTELDVKSEIVYRIRREGAEGDSFDHIVVFGKKTSIPHARSGKEKLQKGDVILIDAGARYEGYCSDITRCFFFGKPEDEVIKAYRALLSAKRKAEELLCENVPLRKVDAEARKELSRWGFGDNFTHGLGHGLGLEIHERPNLSPLSKDRLEDGMVFTIEPGVYFKGRFGLRIEDGYKFCKKPVKLSGLPEEITIL